MRIPISLVILGAVVLAGAGAFGVRQWRDLLPRPSPEIAAPSQAAPGPETAAPGPEMAMARDLIGQWRPPGLTCADAIAITFHSGNLTVDYGSQSEDDMQAVAGLEPNGFIRTYSAQRGSRFYRLEGDTLIMHSADGHRAELERCETAAPATTPAAASAHDTSPNQTSGNPAGAEATRPPAPPPPARAPATETEHAALDETPPPARTLLAAAPAAPPEPIAAPPLPPITRPVWLARPSAAEIAIFYPERALVRELPGSARLDCVVRQDGSLACSVQSEAPAGYGFGEAALRLSQSFRMAQNLDDGSATEGRRVLVSVGFTQN